MAEIGALGKRRLSRLIRLMRRVGRRARVAQAPRGAKKLARLSFDLTTFWNSRARPAGGPASKSSELIVLRFGTCRVTDTCYHSFGRQYYFC